MTRPDPIRLAETLRGLGDCWSELDQALTRVTPNRNHSSPDGRPPLDLDVLDAKRAIETLVYTYAHMLVDDDPEWQPPATVPGMCLALSLRIGHWTHHEDALVSYEFADDVQRVSDETWPIARPNGIGRIPVGPCAEDGCAGMMRATVDRDKIEAMTLAEMWDRTLRCTEDRAHVWLLGMYAREVTGLDDHEIAGMVANALTEA